MELNDTQKQTLAILKQLDDGTLTESKAKELLVQNEIHPDMADAMLARQRGVSDLVEE
jgi:hypothetical protein